MDFTIGFVGLGSMGSPMASRIARGYPVLAFDLDGDRLDAQAEVEPVDDLRALAEGSDIICLSLPTAAASHAVVNELCSGEGRAGIIVEMSTVGPANVGDCAAIAQEAGVELVDAPVSGGVAAAIEGRLSAMVSGANQAIEEVKPILDLVASQVFAIGERPGLGQVMKLVNNIIALSVLPITSEALAFGALHGLTLEEMIEVINASSGRTQRSEVMFPKSIIPETFDHGATGEIVRKDVGLFLEAATHAGSSVRLADAVDRLYDAFVTEHPGTDYSYLHRYIEEHPNDD